MKQIVFVSGKGGTGKSTLVLSLSQMIQDRLLADCDVDAPNLHLIIQSENLMTADFYGAREARINLDQCRQCGKCREVCRFGAINPDYTIRDMACEGCAACLAVCPHGAISLIDVKTGTTSVGRSQDLTFADAKLEIGAEGSGRLVTEVRKNIDSFKKDEQIALIDGSPGTGCVVIASITATDAAVVVAEPTRSGRHDLDRVLSVAEHFRVPAFVCINKYDLNLEVTEMIEEDCRTRNVPVLAKIPFEPEIVKAIQQFKTPVDAGLENVIGPIQDLWHNLAGHMSLDGTIEVKTKEAANGTPS